MSATGMAAHMLREGNTPEHVAKTVRMPLQQVQAIAREVQRSLQRAANNATSAPRQRPLLYTERSAAIREEIAKMPPPKTRTRAEFTGHGEDWSDEDKAELGVLIAHAFTHKQIARMTGRTHAAVQLKAVECGFKAITRNNHIIRALFQARYYLRRNDHITALDIIETATAKECTHGRT